MDSHPPIVLHHAHKTKTPEAEARASQSVARSIELFGYMDGWECHLPRGSAHYATTTLGGCEPPHVKLKSLGEAESVKGRVASSFLPFFRCLARLLSFLAALVGMVGSPFSQSPPLGVGWYVICKPESKVHLNESANQNPSNVRHTTTRFIRPAQPRRVPCE